MADDYYELLGVGRDVSDSELKKAYRKKALQFHPDRNPGDKQAEEQFKKVSNAYEVLKDPEKRALYDRYGSDAFRRGMGGGGARGAGGFHDPADIFREVFGGSSGIGGFFDGLFSSGVDTGRSGARPGANLQYNMELTLEEAARGAEKKISFRRATSCNRCNGDGVEPGTSKRSCPNCGGVGQVTSSRGFFRIKQTCPQCRGTGSIVEYPCKKCSGQGRTMTSCNRSVKIPPGVDTGSRVRVEGLGEDGVSGGPTGDLFILIHVLEHDTFDRDGEDLFIQVPIKFTLAALGGAIEVPTLASKATLKIPAGTQSGTRFRMRKKGLRSLRGIDYGDQYVTVHVEVPRKLKPRQRELLEAFARESGDDRGPNENSFFDKAKRFFDE